jgi:NADH-quinone oxidoreductase subunit J
MLTSFGLFYFFSSFCILSSLFVIFTKNPIFSILFLIFSFTNVSCLLFLFNFEFLPISFLVIYVGAIAVLFLFVLMMLNIKLAELQENYYSFLPIAIIFGFIFLVELLFLFRSEFVFLDIFNESSIVFLSDFLNISSAKTDFNTMFGVNSNIKTISIALFNNYLFSFILSGFVLLLAMVAAIILTIQKTFVSKTQNIYAQIMADYSNTVVHYS